MPQNKPLAKMESNGGMTFEPLKPGGIAPYDTTVPHALDQTLPDPNPNVQQPTISPLEGPDTLKVVEPKVAPGQYKYPGMGGMTRT